jgi:hypothetical protein
MSDPSPADIEAFVARACAGQLPESEAPAAYAAIGALRELADRYERDLIRSLRWDKAGNVIRTWAQVADAVQAQLGSRQAAHARWGRLKSPTRNTTVKGRPKRIGDGMTAERHDGVPS